MEVKNINAVLSKDLCNILEHKGLYQDFIKGNMVCALCGETISPDNLGAIFIQSDQIEFCCSNINCIETIRGK